MRVSARRNNAHDQGLIRSLSRVINTSLKADQQRQTEEVGGEIDTLLYSYTTLHKGTWYHMKGWYKTAANHAPPPTRLTLNQIMAERVVWYCRKPPLGDNIPISVDPFPLEDSITTEEKTKWEMRRLRVNPYGSPSGMREDHLRKCLREDRKEAEAAAEVLEEAG